MTRHIKFAIFGCFCIVVLTLTVLFVEKRRSNYPEFPYPIQVEVEDFSPMGRPTYSVNIGDDGVITVLFGSTDTWPFQGLIHPLAVKSSVISLDDMLTLKSMIKGIADRSQEYPLTGGYHILFQADGEIFGFSDEVPGLWETIEFLNSLSPIPIDLDSGS
ncbi:MAG: hypothetical protein PHV61_09515 [Limnochordia bacterium]|jgi:hypothetical protein|nr:hypothetical protein [Limnochordia bacterium]